MNAAVAALFAGVVLAVGILGYATLHSSDHDACVQRNQGRAAVRNIIERQRVGYDKIKDLANEDAIRAQIKSDLEKVQPLDCG